MMENDLSELSRLWLIAKETEAKGIFDRRVIEDRIKSLAGVSDNLDGTETVTPGGYTIKIVGRIDRKVDADKIQEIAAENGLTEHLSSLFRWKPEVNMSVWRSADESITKLLSAAITAKPGRPSFSIARSD